MTVRIKSSTEGRSKNTINKMLQPGFAQYFIAIVPSHPAFEQAMEWKLYVSQHYGATAALRSPPHITLHMPFQWKLSREDDLNNGFRNFAKTQNSFPISLNGFGWFEPRVIFIRVEESPSLHSLQNQLVRFCRVQFNLFNAQYQDKPFYPHLTIAFRDLKKPDFYRAQREFGDRQFSAHFEATDFALLKHDGKKWQVLSKFALAGL